jgi:hypothetical protein
VHSDSTYILSLHIGDLRRDDKLVAQDGTTGRKAMAQDRKFSGQNRVAGSYSRDDFWSKESILEEGGAYLPETPRVGKLLRFLDALDTADVTTADTQCGNNARCNNSTCYGPNTSRRQLHSQERRLCVGNTTIVQNRTGSIRLVRENGTDWKELWDLSYALLFKTLRLLLLVSVTSVQVSTVLVESISWWLDRAMPRALELGHKKGWENTKGHSHQQSYEDKTH